MATKPGFTMDEAGRADNLFEPTRTILSGSAFFNMPEILQDETHRLWSFKAARGGRRVVLGYDDIASCEVVEEGKSPETPRPEGVKGVLSVLANPGSVSRENAARKGKTCLGLSVRVMLRPPVSIALSIPVWKRPVRRTERLYREVREQADGIKAVFDAMMAGGDDGQAD